MNSDPMESQLFTISQLAEEFDISTRTIRFYEEKGLSPAAIKGNQRITAAGTGPGSN